MPNTGLPHRRLGKLLRQTEQGLFRRIVISDISPAFIGFICQLQLSTVNSGLQPAAIASL